MNVIKILVIILGTIILGALAWAITLPSNIHIERNVEIQAPVETVFKQVNNFHNWKNWAPYQDSTLFTKFEGPHKGLGSKILWTDKKEGRGENKIIESIPNSKVVTVLTFNKDNKAQSTFSFHKIDNDKCNVIWSMDLNDLSFPFGRYVGFMIKKGADYNFNKALIKLKQFVEKNKNAPDYKGYNIYDENIKTKYFISILDSSTIKNMKSAISKDFEKVLKIMTKNKIAPKPYPTVEWNTYNPNGISQFRCLMPINNFNKDARNIKAFYEIAEGRTVWIKYIGSYEKSYIAWDLLDKYIKENNLKMNGAPYEEYILGPKSQPDSSKWITNIFFPVK